MVGSVGELRPLLPGLGESWSGGKVMFLGRAGRFWLVAKDCFCRLCADVVDRNGGVLFVPIFANPATLSLANDASDLLLLLVTRTEEETECW